MLSKYRLLKPISTGFSSSQKGVYLDITTGRKVFIKTDPNRKSLQREFANHQFFYRFSQNSPVVIPRPLALSRSILVMEYISNPKGLLKSTTPTLLRSYLQALKFLHLLSPHTQLTRKSTTYQLLTLPYFLFNDLIHFPSHAILFFRSALVILRHFLGWLTLSIDTVCHGDINVANILISQNKVILLDFASSCISHKFFNFAQALNSAWFQTGFHQRLWSAIIQQFELNRSDQKLLKTFVIYNLLQRLSQRYPNHNQEKFYLQRLYEFQSNF